VPPPGHMPLQKRCTYTSSAPPPSHTHAPTRTHAHALVGVVDSHLLTFSTVDMQAHHSLLPTAHAKSPMLPGDWDARHSLSDIAWCCCSRRMHYHRCSPLCGYRHYHTLSALRVYTSWHTMLSLPFSSIYAQFAALHNPGCAAHVE
jgi:hypothetical protein